MKMCFSALLYKRLVTLTFVVTVTCIFLLSGNSINSLFVSAKNIQNHKNGKPAENQ